MSAADNLRTKYVMDVDVKLRFKIKISFKNYRLKAKNFVKNLKS